MERHFHEELRDLKEHLLKMALLVEGAVKKAVEALIERDQEKARIVIKEEEAINRMEIEIDDKGHQLLLLEQPVAVDLRRLSMIFKINTDLERMGDHAVNVAERALRLIDDKNYGQSLPVSEMADAAMEMLKHAIDCFLHEDESTAQKVLDSDDNVDRLNNEIYYQLKALMEKNRNAVSAGINYAMIAYNIERIADLASNIAEDVIYIKKGKEVRHQSGDNPAR